MNNISTINRGPLLPREPKLSPTMRGALDHIAELAYDAKVTVRSESDRADAAGLIPEYERLCAPAQRVTIETWLGLLVYAVRNPPEEGQFEGRLRGVIDCLSDLPLGAWSDDTAREAMQTFKFWPAVADVDDLLRPTAEHLHRTLRSLRRMATAEMFVPPRGVTQEQERDYIREAVLGRLPAQPDVTDRGRDSAETPRDVTPSPAREILKDRAPPPMPPTSALLQDVIRAARQRLMEGSSGGSRAAPAREGQQTSDGEA